MTSGDDVNNGVEHGPTEYFRAEERESMLAACITNHLRCSKNYRVRSFVLRWDDAERRLKEKGAYCVRSAKASCWSMPASSPVTAALATPVVLYRSRR